MLSSFILCAICAGVLIIYSWYCHFRPSAILLNKLPGPKAWPVVGNALDVIVPPERIFETLREWTNQYGDILHVWALHIQSIIVNNPNDAEKILSSFKHTVKGTPYNFIRPWLSEGLTVSNGQKWHRRRKMLTPSFHLDILKNFLSSFVEQTKVLVTKLEAEVGKERTNLVPLVTQTTLNILCQTAMGISEEQEEIKDYVESIHTFGECLVHRITRVWQHFNLVYFFSQNRLKRDSAVTKLHKFTTQVVEERRAVWEKSVVNEVKSTDNLDVVYGAKRMALLDSLLKHENQGNIDRLGVREEVDSFMFAGHHSSASAVSLFFTRIAGEHEIQIRLHQEMDKIFADGDLRDPTIGDLNAMTYLECCIKELLRLYPSVPLIVRDLKEDIELSGYKIPKGTVCGINIYDIHRRIDIYPEPEKFIPERFLPENSDNRHTYSFIPFSAGPRNCVGQRFAMMMMKTIISGILRRYKVEPVTRVEDLKFTTDIVIRTCEPYYVRILRRD